MRSLGNGGFAEVYLAEHMHLGYPVAIKFLHADPGRFENQFFDEAKLIAGLQHPHIIRLMDFGIEPSTYLAMEYAAGGTLRHIHPRGIPVAPILVARYVEQIASALQYVHDLRFIHCDVKPENILLRTDGSVALSDFGIAAVLRTMHTHVNREFQGSAYYCAPEQINGKPSPASDQYSLGVVVYELLSGQPPFQAQDMFALMYQHVHTPPRPLRELVQSISPDVEAIVMRTLVKEPRDRFARVADFAASLSQAVEATGISDLPVWITPGFTTTATSFGNQETAMLTPSFQGPLFTSAASSQAVEEITPTLEQSSQQVQVQDQGPKQKRTRSRARNVVMVILGVLASLGGLLFGIYAIYWIANYLNAAEGSQILNYSTQYTRGDNIVLLFVIIGFIYALVYSLIANSYPGHFQETNNLGAAAYALCGSTAAAVGAAFLLMVIYPALGGTPTTALDWKVLGIVSVVFVLEAIAAGWTAYVNYRDYR